MTGHCHVRMKYLLSALYYFANFTIYWGEYRQDI